MPRPLESDPDVRARRSPAEDPFLASQATGRGERVAVNHRDDGVGQVGAVDGGYEAGAGAFINDTLPDETATTLRDLEPQNPATLEAVR